MSTPAAQVLSGGAAPAGGGAPGGQGAAPPAGGGAGGSAPAGGAPAAAFYETWLPANDANVKDAREWLSTKNFKDPVAFVQSARETERTAHELRAAAALKGYPSDKTNPDGTVVKADENARKAWNAAMGVPATADEYGLKPPEGDPYPQFTGYMAQLLHNAGVPPAMAKLLYDGYNAANVKLLTELRAAEDATSAAAVKNLETEWGANFRERVALGARGKEFLSKEVGGISDEQWRSMEGLFGTAKMMSLMWKIGAGNGEAKFPSGGGQPAFEGGVDAAKAAYAQLQADRAAGKISTEEYRKREPELAAAIAGGFAPATN
jgi:hypothetical protein